MEKQSGYYILATLFCSLIGIGYVFYLREILVLTVLHDFLYIGLIVSIFILMCFLIIEQYGYPSLKVIKQVGVSLSVFFFLFVFIGIMCKIIV